MRRAATIRQEQLFTCALGQPWGVRENPGLLGVWGISWIASLLCWYPPCGTQLPHVVLQGEFQADRKITGSTLKGVLWSSWKNTLHFFLHKVILTRIRQPVRKINSIYINSCKCMALRKVLNLMNFRLPYYHDFATKI